MLEIDRHKVPPELDQRRKLTNEDRTEIVSLHKAGRSCRSLALDYGVSPTLIRRVVNPEYAKNQDQYRRTHDFYDPIKQKEWTDKSRNRRKKLLAEGRLLEKEG